MYDALCKVLDSKEFSIVERFEIPEREAQFGQIPRFLFNSRIGLHLNSQAKENGWEEPLWVHQAQALESLGNGENVVVSTGTASGKSLIFRSFAFHQVLLHSQGRVLVFYPLKALAADQVLGWKKMARSLKLEDGIIGLIDGSVPVKEREGILQQARVIIMTPDVCHAWLMHRLSLPIIKDFIKDLFLVVIDEAHTLEGIFGSNFAFLIRRLIAARNLLLEEKQDSPPLQLIAATATIQSPGEHMKHLTGLEFKVVSHKVDGARQHKRIVAHVGCPVGEEYQVARQLQERVLRDGKNGSFITFLDSRKGVEGLAISSRKQQSGKELGELLNYADVLPYRAGYNAGDRKKIERRLQSGSLRGVVSTSALELGIDIPYLRVGFSIGVPNTRKAYRQRLGRVGRNGPGVFIVIAPLFAFTGYGTSFREYHEMSVEPSYLYLDNRFMQFAHGRCLAFELESLSASSSTPSHIAWPKGFKEMHSAARPGGTRPPEFDAIATLGSDTPHYGYPLRNVGEVSFKIKMMADGESIGEVNQLQALRECYPGALYLHLARAYEVTAWHTSSFDPFIRVKPAAPNKSTKPRIRTWINAGITPSDILETHLIQGTKGFLTECHMQITERVEGYVDVNTDRFHSYQDLRQKNPNLCARSRNFRTSGVLLHINSDWFKPLSTRQAFVGKLLEVYLREYSIAPQDISSSASNILVQTVEGNKIRGGCVAIFDETYGSLRLTERLYLEFEHLLSRLSDAVSVNPTDDCRQLEDTATKIQKKVSEFSDTAFQGDLVSCPSKGYEQVFTNGSRVCYRQVGQMAADVEIIQPTMMDGNLMYQVKISPRPGQNSVKRWVAASSIEPSADTDNWEYAWWNIETEVYEDPPDDEE